jgi:FMN phosphatase YigB (HAD superfamily)
MQGIRVCVFDAYGTLFDVAAAARELAADPGREDFAEGLAAGLRRLAVEAVAVFLAPRRDG